MEHNMNYFYEIKLKSWISHKIDLIKKNKNECSILNLTDIHHHYESHQQKTNARKSRDM